MSIDQIEIRDRLFKCLESNPGEYATHEAEFNWRAEWRQLRKELSHNYDPKDPIAVYALFEAKTVDELKVLERYYRDLADKISGCVGEEVMTATKGHGSRGHDFIRGVLGAYTYDIYQLGQIQSPTLDLSFTHLRGSGSPIGYLSIATEGYAQLNTDLQVGFYGGRLSYSPNNLHVPGRGLERAIGTEAVGVWKDKHDRYYQELEKVLTEKGI